MRLISKHRAAVWEYTADFSAYLAAGETLSTITVEVASGEVTVPAPGPVISGSVVTFWVAGGTAWSDCLLVATAVTNQGRTLPIDLQLFVF